MGFNHAAKVFEKRVLNGITEKNKDILEDTFNSFTEEQKNALFNMDKSIFDNSYKWGLWDGLGIGLCLSVIGFLGYKLYKDLKEQAKEN